MANSKEFTLGSRVKLSRKYINNWIFSHDNYESACVPGLDINEYAQAEYDQEMMLAMFTLMGEPVYGVIKGLGCDDNTFLCYFAHAGLRHWRYLETQNLVLLD